MGPASPQKLPLSCGSGGGESNHEAEILGLFLNAADFRDFRRSVGYLP
jgi:hypothetical protein